MPDELIEDWDRVPLVNDLCEHLDTKARVLVKAVNGLDVVVVATDDNSPVRGPVPYSLFQFKRLFRLVRAG